MRARVGLADGVDAGANLAAIWAVGAAAIALLTALRRRRFYQAGICSLCCCVPGVMTHVNVRVCSTAAADA